MDMIETPVLAEHQAAPKDASQVPVQDSEAQADVKMVLDLYAQGKQARKKYDTNWDQYEQFYRGKQWDEGRSPDRANPVVNVCRVTIQAILPILTDGRPTFNVLPPKPQDYKFATGLSQITDAWWQKFDVGMDHTLVEVLMDSQIFDVGILKTVWDPSAEEGAGDIRCAVVSPKDIFIPDGARDFHKDCPWVIERFHKPVGELKAQFPDMAAYIKADDENKQEESVAKSANEITLVSPIDKNVNLKSNETGSHGDERKLALVLECWMDDNSLEEYEAEEEINGVKQTVTLQRKKYPRGKLITILPNQKVRLQGVENPYKHAKKPYVRFIDAIMPRQFYGEGEIGSLVDTQKVINKVLGNILDYINLMSNPIWVIEKDSGVDPDDVTNAYGLIITPDSGKSAGVKREMAPPVQQALFQFYEMMQRTSEMISGASEITQGRQATGITAASAIEGIQEAAQTRIRLKERNMKVSLGQLGYLVVQLIMQYYSEPRMARLSTETQWPDFFEFFFEDTPEGTVMNRQNYLYNQEADEYVPDGQYQKTAPTRGIFDVEVTSGTALPFQKSQKINTAFQLADRGAIDAEALLTATEWPDKEEIINRMAQAAQVAQRQAMIAPQAPIK